MTDTNKKKQLEERINKTRAAAHDRVVRDGTIQFRLDAENMEKILSVADDRRTGAGVLARMWVLERLKHELCSERINHSSGPAAIKGAAPSVVMEEESSGYGTPDSLFAAAACELIKMFRSEQEQRNRILEASAQQAKAIADLLSMLAQQNQALESIKLAMTKRERTT